MERLLATPFMLEIETMLRQSYLLTAAGHEA